jgi:hypothetical protein
VLEGVGQTGMRVAAPRASAACEFTCRAHTSSQTMARKTNMYSKPPAYSTIGPPAFNSLRVNRSGGYNESPPPPSVVFSKTCCATQLALFSSARD